MQLSRSFEYEISLQIIKKHEKIKPHKEKKK